MGLDMSIIVVGKSALPTQLLGNLGRGILKARLW